MSAAQLGSFAPLPLEDAYEADDVLDLAVDARRRDYRAQDGAPESVSATSLDNTMAEELFLASSARSDFRIAPAPWQRLRSLARGDLVAIPVLMPGGERELESFGDIAANATGKLVLLLHSLAAKVTSQTDSIVGKDFARAFSRARRAGILRETFPPPSAARTGARDELQDPDAAFDQVMPIELYFYPIFSQDKRVGAVALFVNYNATFGLSDLLQIYLSECDAASAFSSISAVVSQAMRKYASPHEASRPDTPELLRDSPWALEDFFAHGNLQRRLGAVNSMAQASLMLENGRLVTSCDDELVHIRTGDSNRVVRTPAAHVLYGVAARVVEHLCDQLGQRALDAMLPEHAAAVQRLCACRALLAAERMQMGATREQATRACLPVLAWDVLMPLARTFLPRGASPEAEENLKQASANMMRLCDAGVELDTNALTAEVPYEHLVNSMYLLDSGTKQTLNTHDIDPALLGSFVGFCDRAANIAAREKDLAAPAPGRRKSVRRNMRARIGAALAAYTEAPRLKPAGPPAPKRGKKSGLEQLLEMMVRGSPAGQAVGPDEAPLERGLPAKMVEFFKEFGAVLDGERDPFKPYLTMCRYGNVCVFGNVMCKVGDIMGGLGKLADGNLFSVLRIYVNALTAGQCSNTLKNNTAQSGEAMAGKSYGNKLVMVVLPKSTWLALDHVSDKAFTDGDPYLMLVIFSDELPQQFFEAGSALGEIVKAMLVQGFIGTLRMGSTADDPVQRSTNTYTLKVIAWIAASNYYFRNKDPLGTRFYKEIKGVRCADHLGTKTTDSPLDRSTYLSKHDDKISFMTQMGLLKYFVEISIGDGNMPPVSLDAMSILLGDMISSYKTRFGLQPLNWRKQTFIMNAARSLTMLNAVFTVFFSALNSRPITRETLPDMVVDVGEMLWCTYDIAFYTLTLYRGLFVSEVDCAMSEYLQIKFGGSAAAAARADYMPDEENPYVRDPRYVSLSARSISALADQICNTLRKSQTLRTLAAVPPANAIANHIHDLAKTTMLVPHMRKPAPGGTLLVVEEPARSVEETILVVRPSARDENQSDLYLLAAFIERDPHSDFKAALTSLFYERERERDIVVADPLSLEIYDPLLKKDVTFQTQVAHSVFRLMPHPGLRPGKSDLTDTSPLFGDTRDDDEDQASDDSVPEDSSIDDFCRRRHLTTKMGYSDDDLVAPESPFALLPDDLLARLSECQHAKGQQRAQASFPQDYMEHIEAMFSENVEKRKRTILSRNTGLETRGSQVARTFRVGAPGEPPASRRRLNEAGPFDFAH